MNHQTGSPSTSENVATEPQTWAQAWRACSGPRNWLQALDLAIKGLCVGTADIIPGVSGGTLAFVFGIYEKLLAAIASFDLEATRQLFAGRMKAMLAHVHVRFLLPLCFGIAVAFVGMTHLIHWLMAEHEVLTWSAFFGLVAASVVVVARQVREWNAFTVAMLLAGTALGWLITGLLPAETPNALWFVFLCGVISICAMILPGISGSFIMLILGKYLYVTGALKTITRDPAHVESLVILFVYAAGAVIGLVGFSRVLKWCLARYHAGTMCLLTGLMLGSIRKLWPWKHAVRVLQYPSDGHVKTKVLEEVYRLPSTYAQEYEQVVVKANAAREEIGQGVETVAGQPAQLLPAVGLILAGFAVVLLLEWFSSSRDERTEPAA